MMKIIITAGQQPTVHENEYTERYAGPAATKWVQRHPRLYWLSLYWRRDRFYRFMSTYLKKVEMSRLQKIRIEISGKRDGDALVFLADSLLGHRRAGCDDWVEERALHPSEFISSATNLSVCEKLQDGIHVRMLDLIWIGHAKRMVWASDAIEMSGREKIRIQQVHSSSTVTIYEITPCHQSLYFVSLLLIARMTSGKFVIDLLEKNNITNERGQAALCWFLGASEAHRRLSMSHAAKLVASTAMDQLVAIHAKVVESKPEVPSKPLGHAKKLIEELAAALCKLKVTEGLGLAEFLDWQRGSLPELYLQDLAPEILEQAQQYLVSASASKAPDQTTGQSGEAGC